MVKSYYLFKFLPAAVVFFCAYAGGTDVKSAADRSPKEELRGMAENRQRELLQTIYTAELGVREYTGRNDGKRVEEYLAYVHLKKGSPWCAAFVCWALGRAGIENPRSGWSPDLFPSAKIVWQRSRPVKTEKALPQAGDIFGIWFSDKGRIAHTGFVDHWEGKWMVSVEGNTNTAGSREGDGVYRKRRLANTIYRVSGFIGREKI